MTSPAEMFLTHIGDQFDGHRREMRETLRALLREVEDARRALERELVGMQQQSVRLAEALDGCCQTLVRVMGGEEVPFEELYGMWEVGAKILKEVADGRRQAADGRRQTG